MTTPLEWASALLLLAGAGFYLAGDWTDTGLPGTIESAAVSGHLAASAIDRT